MALSVVVCYFLCCLWLLIFCFHSLLVSPSYWILSFFLGYRCLLWSVSVYSTQKNFWRQSHAVPSLNFLLKASKDSNFTVFLSFLWHLPAFTVHIYYSRNATTFYKKKKVNNWKKILHLQQRDKKDVNFPALVNQKCYLTANSNFDIQLLKLLQFPQSPWLSHSSAVHSNT